MSEKRQFVYSHGLGVRRDSLGLFTEIARSLPEHDHHMFDYDLIVHSGGVENQIVRPLEEQAEQLEKVISVAKKLGHVTFVGHSRGCLPLGFVDLEPIEEIYWLNPMVKDGNKAVADGMDKAAKEELTRKSDNEVIVWPMKTASGELCTIYVPKTYFRSMKFDRLQTYKDIAAEVRPTVFRGTKDKMIGLVGEYEIEHADYVDIEGAGHNFGGPTRDVLIDELVKRVHAEK